MEQLIHPYMPSIQDNHRSDSGTSPEIQFNSPKLYNDKMFSLIEKYSTQVSRLNFIRSFVTPTNALEVHQLIQSEEYLNWDKKKLKKFFD